MIKNMHYFKVREVCPDQFAEIRVSSKSSVPCCTAKPHKGGRDRKMEGCHPEADLGNNPAGPY